MGTIMTMQLSRINCQGCLRRVVKALEALPGVEVLETTLATRSVTVRYDEARGAWAEIEAALAALGRQIEHCTPHEERTSSGSGEGAAC